MAETQTLDVLVDVYRRIRAAIDEAEDAHKTKIAELKEQLETVAAKLLQACNDQNADSIKTPMGTVSRRVQSRFWTTDWDSMYQFIRENDAPFLLEQRIHNGNMKQFLEENPDAMPAGLQVDRKYVIQVRKPTNR
jgi:hypothetical protein